MRQEAPVRTGTLRDSIRIPPTPSGYRVGPTHPKAIMIEQGTRPSRGKYVPKLGRRIKRGFHPGTRANPFVDRTFRRTVEFVDAELERIARR